MVNNAQQRASSPIFGTTNNNSNRMTVNNNSSNTALTQLFNNANISNDMGRRLERMVSAPVLPVQPKSCLRRKSCQQKTIPASKEITDKDTDTNTVTDTDSNGEQKR